MNPRTSYICYVAHKQNIKKNLHYECQIVEYGNDTYLFITDRDRTKENQ